MNGHTKTIMSFIADIVVIGKRAETTTRNTGLTARGGYNDY